MRAVIITIAGVSSRFNEGLPLREHSHKSIYHEGDRRNTLLYHLLEKCRFADRIILVGGSCFDEVKEYCSSLPVAVKEKIKLVYNEHYADLASGYSLYLGLSSLFEEENNYQELLFVEGDLDIDRESFQKAVDCPGDVISYSYEPIYASKAVVLYQNAEGRYRYAFNSSHGLLQITEPFSMILNSGQMWKFTNMDLLQKANRKFYQEEKDGTNLRIIQNYLDNRRPEDITVVGLLRWTNCNTRQDYKKILAYWEGEAK